MKYIFIADLHLAAYSNDPVISGIPEKLFFTMTVLDNIIEYARKNEIKNIVIAGDIIHTKSIIHSVAQSMFLDFIRKNNDFTFIIIDGNHDMSSRSGQGISALKFCDNEINVKMFHNADIYEDLWLVPWNPDTMVKDITSGSSKNFLVSHLGVTEAKLNSGISIVSDIKLKDFKKYKHCFLGHYHKPQSLGNISYIGSPIQMDWGEKHEEKRFMVLDSETGEIESIPTIGYRKYFEFDLTKENKDIVLETCGTLQNDGHHIKLNKVEEFDTNDIDNKFRVVVSVEKDITDRGIKSSMTIDQKLTKYLEIKKVSENDKEFIKKTGISIINECDNKKSRGL